MLDLLDAALPAPARGVFTLRTGGTSGPPYDALNLSGRVGDEPSQVEANRALVAGELGLEPAQLVLAEQVHGAQVAVVQPGGAGPQVVAGVDALVTRHSGLGLVVLAADCLPVLFADVAAGVVAAAHAGRRGLVAGALEATLAAMVGQGAVVARVVASVGPAAGGCCYELPRELADEVGDAVPGSRATTRSGTPSIDLRAGAEALLRAAGVQQVRHTDACTVHDDRFYSYRRNGVTGRHAGVVALP